MAYRGPCFGVRRVPMASISPVRLRDAVEDFLARLLPEQRARIAQVIVFGSVARGEAGPESDVDLLIVWRGKIEDAYRDLIPIATDLLIERRVDLSIHPIVTEEYERIERIRTGFFENVDREGLVVA